MRIFDYFDNSKSELSECAKMMRNILNEDQEKFSILASAVKEKDKTILNLQDQLRTAMLELENIENVVAASNHQLQKPNELSTVVIHLNGYITVLQKKLNELEISNGLLSSQRDLEYEVALNTIKELTTAGNRCNCLDESTVDENKKLISEPSGQMNLCTGEVGKHELLFKNSRPAIKAHPRLAIKAHPRLTIKAHPRLAIKAHPRHYLEEDLNDEVKSSIACNKSGSTTYLEDNLNEEFDSGIASDKSASTAYLEEDLNDESGKVLIRINIVLSEEVSCFWL